MKCNICQWSGPAFRAGPRSEKLCPKCGSRARWRHMKYALAQYKLHRHVRGGNVLLVGGSQVEQNVLGDAAFVERISLTNPNHARIIADLADLSLFPNKCMDLVWACHVLEHVRELSNAMSEVYRVLRPGRSAVFCVPIPRRDKSKFKDHADRQGHWWAVGRDWPDAYTAAGFKVRESYGTDCPSSLGVKRDNLVSVCTRSE